MPGPRAECGPPYQDHTGSPRVPMTEAQGAGRGRLRIRSAAWPASSANRWPRSAGRQPKKPAPGSPPLATAAVTAPAHQLQGSAARAASLRITMERSTRAVAALTEANGRDQPARQAARGGASRRCRRRDGLQRKRDGDVARRAARRVDPVPLFASWQGSSRGGTGAAHADPQPSMSSVCGAPLRKPAPRPRRVQQDTGRQRRACARFSEAAFRRDDVVRSAQAMPAFPSWRSWGGTP